MKRTLQRMLVGLLVLSLLCTCTLAEGTLRLPAGLRTIEEQAFYGLNAVDEVIVPDGTERIESQAFANSSLSKITLPDSVTYIAPDAFDDCGVIKPTFESKGSYAYQWWNDKYGLEPTYYLESAHPYPDLVDEVRSWQGSENAVALEIHFSPKTHTGGGEAEIYILDGEGQVVTVASGEELAWSWITVPGNSFKIRLKGKNYESANFGYAIDGIREVFEGPVRITGIEPESTNHFVNVDAGWFVATDGYYEPFTFEYKLFKDGVQVGSLEDSPNKYLMFTPKEEGTYQLSVRVTDARGNVAEATSAVMNIVTPTIADLFTYRIKMDDTAEIVGLVPYLDYFPEIPSEIDGYTVTSIGERAFAELDLKGANIVIPSTITKIGKYAFGGCTGMTSVYLPVSLQEIHWGAFYDCNPKPIFESEDSYAYRWWANRYGIYQDVEALLESDHPYASNLRETKTWEGAADTIALQIHFTANTRVEYYCDWIYLLDGSGEVIERYTDNNLADRTITIRGNQFGVRLESDGGGSDYGYAIDKIVEIKDSSAVVTDIRLVSTDNLVGTYLKWQAGIEGLLRYADCTVYRNGERYQGLAIEGWSGEVWYRPDQEGTYTLLIEATGEDGVTREKWSDPVTVVAPTQEQLFPHRILSDNTVEITGYLYDACDFPTLPTTIGGRTVTSIGDGAFAGKSLWGEINLPSTLTRIGDRAFDGCEYLGGTLNIPAGVTSIGAKAFTDCRELHGQLNLPAGLKEIGDEAFAWCYNLGGQLNLPAGLTKLGAYAFAGCVGLGGSLVIPEGITKIEQGTFNGCYSLTGTVTFPSGLTSIGAYSFAGCNRLSGNLVIPNTVTEIGDWAFQRCYSLTGQLTLSSSLTKISKGAFAECDGFTGTLVIPEGVTEIGNYAFYYSHGYTGLSLPSTLQTIGEMAFEDCAEMRGTLVLPDGLKNIFYGAFRQCGFTGSLTIPGSVICIDSQAFRNNHFTGTLTIEDGVLEIGYAAFAYCNGFTGTLTLPRTLIELGDYAFQECYGFTGNLVIPGTLKEVYSNAFRDCAGITSVRFSSGVKKIYQSAFHMCNSLTSAYFPASLDYIDEDAFDNVLALNCTFESENSYASRWWNELKRNDNGYPQTMHPYTTNRETTKKWQGDESTVGLIIYFSEQTEVAEEDWIDVSDYKGSIIRYYGSELAGKVISLEGNTVNITLYSWSGEEGHYGYSIDNIIQLQDGPVNIRFIERTDNEELAGGYPSWNVVMDGSLEPFTFTYRLMKDNELVEEWESDYRSTNIYVGEPGTYYLEVEVTDAEGNVSRATSETASFRMPVGVEAYEYSLLYDGVGIMGYRLKTGELIPIPAEIDGQPVIRIGSYAFANMPSVTGEAVIPANVKRIDDYAFYYCSGLTSIYLGDNIEYIGDNAFYQCENLVPVFESEGSYAYVWWKENIGFPGAFPESPHPYKSNMNKTRYWTGDENTISMKIRFSDETKLESGCDWIYILYDDGNTYGGYSGTELAGQTITLPGNSFGVQMLTDGSIEYYGYSIDEITQIHSGPVEIQKVQPWSGNCNYVGGVIHWNVIMDGDQEPFTYTYNVYRDGELVCEDIIEGSIDQSNYSYRATELGQYVLRVHVVDANGNESDGESAPVTLHMPTAEEVYGYSVEGDGTAKITSYGLIDGELIPIPETIDGRAVTVIGESSMAYKYEMTGELVLPSTVKTIGYRAFAYDCGLTGDLVIPEGVEVIGAEAFRNCVDLDGRLVIPSTVTSIYYDTFANCRHLTSVYLPDSLTYIDETAFQGCDMIQPIFESENSYAYSWWLENIGQVGEWPESPHPYKNSSSLTRVWQGDDDAEVLKIRFSNLTEVEEGCDFITIRDRNDNTVGRYTGTELAGKTVYVQGNRFSVLLESDDNYTYYGYAIDSVEQIVDGPAVIEEIRRTSDKNYAGARLEWEVDAYGAHSPLDYAFTLYKDNEVLDTQTSEDGYYEYRTAESGSYRLKVEVTDTNGDVTEAYSDTVVLHEPSDEEPFEYRVLDDGTAEITGYDRYNCELPPIPAHLDGYVVTSIGDQAFLERHDLTGTLTLPGTLTRIGALAFDNCTELTGDIIIPDSVTTIGYSAFAYCINMRGTLKISENVTTLPGSVFSGCPIVGLVRIPSGVTTIEYAAFWGDSTIDSIYLPASLEEIDIDAFNYCYNLFPVFESEDSYAYRWWTENYGIVSANPETEHPYQNDDECTWYWMSNQNTMRVLIRFSEQCEVSDYLDVLDGDGNYVDRFSGTEMAGKTVEIEGDRFIIRVRADSTCYGFAIDEIVEIPGGPVNIMGIDHEKEIEEDRVTLSWSLTTCGNLFPFSYSYTLERDGEEVASQVREEDTFEFEVNRAGEYTLTVVITDNESNEATISDTLTVADADLFRYEVTGEGEAAITGYRIESVELPAIPAEIDGYAVTEIAENAFYNRSDLTGALVIPSSVTKIGYHAFYRCTGFTSVYLGDQLTDINECAFEENYLIEPIFESNDSYAHEWWIANIGPIGGLPESRHPYQDNLDMTKYWQGDENTAMLQIHFSADTRTEDNCDYIYILNGDGDTVGRYSGTYLADRTVTVEGNRFGVRLETDGSVTYYGYSIDWIKQIHEGPVSIVSVEQKSNKTYVGKELVWEVETDGNYLPLSYQYTLSLGDNVVSEAQESESTSFAYMTEAPGTYTLVVTVTDCNDNQAQQEVEIEVHEPGATDLYTYRVLDDGTAEIIDFEKMYVDILPIPAEIDGYMVTSIGVGALAYRYDLTGTLVLPNTLTKIDNGAFCESYNLTGDIVIPEGVTYIGSEAFAECRGFDGNIVIPSSITEIQEKVFNDCWRIQSVYLPDSLTAIASNAFTGCNDKLMPIFESEDSYAYQWWADYRGIPGELPVSPHPYRNYMRDTRYWQGSDDAVGLWIRFSEQTKMKEEDDRLYVLNGDGNVVTSFTGTEAAGRVIFMEGNCFGIRFVTGGGETYYGYSIDAVEEVHEGALEITGVEQLNRRAYAGGEAEWCIMTDGGVRPLSYHYILYNNDEMVTETWYGNYNCKYQTDRPGTYRLWIHVEDQNGEEAETEVTLEVSEPTADDAFIYEVIQDGSAKITGYRLSYKEIMPIPATLEGHPVTCIGEEAFYSRNDLTGELVIPEGVTSIENNSFYCCNNLTKVYLPNSLTSIDINAFNECRRITPVFASEDSYAHQWWAENMVLPGAYPESLHPYPGDRYQTKYWYGNEDTMALRIHFSEQTSLKSTDSIVVYDRNGNEIGYYRGTELAGQAITLSGNGFAIEFRSDPGDEEYYGYAVDEIEQIPDGAPYIEGFSQSSVLEFYGGEITWSVNAYSTHKPLNYRYTLYLDDEELFCVDGGYRYSYSTQEAGTYRMEVEVRDCNGNTSVIYGDSLYIREPSIEEQFIYAVQEDGTAEIRGYRLPRKGLVAIPSELDGHSVTSIGEYAFSGMEDMTGELVLPDTLERIGYGAFFGCSSLTGELVIPDSVTYIGEEAFYCCAGFTGDLVIPEGVTAIDDYTFYGCSGLDGELTLPDGLTSIGYNAFEGCCNLTGNLVIPSTVTNISSSAFRGCSGFTGNLVLPYGMEMISNATFSGCSGLTGVYLPVSLNHLYIDSFGDCSSLVPSFESEDSYAYRWWSAMIGIEGEYPESMHPCEPGTRQHRTWHGTEGVLALRVYFSEQTEFGYYDYLCLYDGNGNYICEYTGTSLSGQMVEIPGDSFEISFNTSYYSEGYYGYSIDRIEEVTEIEEEH